MLARLTTTELHNDQEIDDASDGGFTFLPPIADTPSFTIAGKSMMPTLSFNVAEPPKMHLSVLTARLARAMPLKNVKFWSRSPPAKPNHELSYEERKLIPEKRVRAGIRAVSCVP